MIAPHSQLAIYQEIFVKENLQIELLILLAMKDSQIAMQKDIIDAIGVVIIHDKTFIIHYN